MKTMPKGFMMEQEPPLFCDVAHLLQDIENDVMSNDSRSMTNARMPGMKKKGGVLEKQKYCIYNQTRECFLSLSVTRADTSFARLKGLIGRLRLKYDEGLWIVPSSGVHTFGVLFPLDLIYLDEGYRIVHSIEFFRTFRIAPLRTSAASVLQLPIHTIYSSQTQQGDQLLICPPEEMESRLNDLVTYHNDGKGASGVAVRKLQDAI